MDTVIGPLPLVCSFALKSGEIGAGGSVGSRYISYVCWLSFILVGFVGWLL